MLISLGDFTEFKDLMISHKEAKKSKQAKGKVDGDLTVAGKHI
jgi:hypothetical protein